MCIECQRSAPGSQQGGLYGASALQSQGIAQCRAGRELSRLNNPHHVLVYKGKLAEMAENIEKAAALMPPGLFKHRVEEDCKYLKRLATT